MTIGIVLDDTLDTTNGIQQYVVCVGEWIRQRGHEVHYIVGESCRSDIPNMHVASKNVGVRFNGNRLSMPLPVNRRKLRDLLAALQLDVLHVQTPYSPFLAGRLVRAAPPELAVVGTFHILPYGWLARFGSDVLAKMSAKTARRFDAMMATSVPAQVFAREHYGFASTVVANPFRYDVFSVSRRGKRAQHTKKHIVFLGRLVARKGALELLRAVAYLREQSLSQTAFHVTIAGKGPGLSELKRFVAAQGLDTVVSFPGFVAETQKPALLNSGDIVVFPSVSGESFGISLLEGMAASRGVVLAGDNPGYASVVARRQQLINPRDTVVFAQTLARWLDDDSGRATMATIQRTHAAQFDIDVIGPKIEEIYAHALQKRRQS